MTDRREEGMRVRREVLGDAHVDRAAPTEFTRDFQDLITRYAWGEIWTRPGLDRRTRSAITLTVMVARGHLEELALHVRAARLGAHVCAARTGDRFRPCPLAPRRRSAPTTSAASCGRPRC